MCCLHTDLHHLSLHRSRWMSCPALPLASLNVHVRPSLRQARKRRRQGQSHIRLVQHVPKVEKMFRLSVPKVGNIPTFCPKSRECSDWSVWILQEMATVTDMVMSLWNVPPKRLKIVFRSVWTSRNKSEQVGNPTSQNKRGISLGLLVEVIKEHQQKSNDFKNILINLK